MPGSLGFFNFNRMRRPLRRVLAVDAGSRALKLLFAESDFGQVRILRQELIDLQSEGLIAPGEVKNHFQTVLDDLGRPPVALVLPQHVCVSQVIDLPLAPESEVEKLVREEAQKLGGVTESKVIYDFVRVESASRERQQFWVTLCPEGEVRERILRLGLEAEDLSEVTTTANALMAAYRAANPVSGRAILVHLGAQSTVLVIVQGGQGVYATSFQMGTDFFTRSLARLKDCSEDAADALKRSRDLLNGKDSEREFAAVVDGWAAELKSQLQEWLTRNPSVDLSQFEMIGSGAGLDQPGLLAYVKAAAGLTILRWDTSRSPRTAQPQKDFEVAFGTALQALDLSAQPVSLLPEDFRAAWKRRLNRQKLEIASLAVVALCVLLFAMGTWHKLSMIGRQEALLREAQAGQEAFDANDALTSRLTADFEILRPLFAAQQNTVDVLQSLALLQQSRSNRSFWYVLVADQQSYFTLPLPVPQGTNSVAVTNQVSRSFAAERPASLFPPPSLLSTTNLLPAKAGLIAELCVPEDAETSRKLLSQLVKYLKQQPIFSKVDLLSDDLRRGLAEPKVVLPNQDYVMALDFAETDFQLPLRRNRTPGNGPARGPARKMARSPANDNPGSSE